MQVAEGDVVCVDGRAVSLPAAHSYYVLHKPAGVVCTLSPADAHSLGVFLAQKGYAANTLTYAGRLDRLSEGLLVLTDDGDLIQAMMRAKNGHEKEYVVETDRPVTTAFLQQLSQGLYLAELDVRTRPCRAWQTGERQFHIVLTQGLNRQIRRMCQVCGYRVHRLLRVRVVNLLLGDMKPGDMRPLTAQEKSALFAAVYGAAERRRP